MVERLVANEKVVGSSPIARSMKRKSIMIIWIASYPKSGNTYIRSFLASYFFSEKGIFDFDLLLKLHQFPNMKFSKMKAETMEEASKNWIYNQRQFFDKKKLNLVKTHNCLLKYKGNKFTTKNETLGAIYIVRDPRNLITSFTNHYSYNYDQALKFMLDENSASVEKTVDNDHSNFTFLNSWSNHYKSWKNNLEFETMFIKYEDLENNKIEIFSKIVIFINRLLQNNDKLVENKLLNSIKSTNFSNMKNKELNEGFEESVISKKTGKKLNFFNLGFNNRYQKILENNFKKKMNLNFQNDLKELGYSYD